MDKSWPSRLFSSRKIEPAQGIILQEGDLATGPDHRPDLADAAGHRLEEGLQFEGGAPGPQFVDPDPPDDVQGLRLVVRRPRGLARQWGVDLRRNLARRQPGSLQLVDVVIRPLRVRRRLLVEQPLLKDRHFSAFKSIKIFFLYSVTTLRFVSFHACGEINVSC